jgi:hypothetical protein
MVNQDFAEDGDGWGQRHAWASTRHGWLVPALNDEDPADAGPSPKWS